MVARKIRSRSQIRLKLSQRKDERWPISDERTAIWTSIGTVVTVLHGASVPIQGTHIFCHAMLFPVQRDDLDEARRFALDGGSKWSRPLMPMRAPQVIQIPCIDVRARECCGERSQSNGCSPPRGCLVDHSTRASPCGSLPANRGPELSH